MKYLLLTLIICTGCLKKLPEPKKTPHVPQWIIATSHGKDGKVDTFLIQKK